MEDNELKGLIDDKNDEIEKLKADSSFIELKEYYLNKYQDMFSNILNNRSLEISETMESLDKEIETLESTISNNDENIKSNESNKEKIAHIETLIYDLFSQIELARFDKESKEANIKNESIELFKEYYKVIETWNSRLDSYLSGILSNYDLINAMDELEESISSKCYDSSLVIKQNEAKIKEIELEFKAEDERIRKEIDGILKEKENLENRIVNTSIDYQNMKIVELEDVKRNKQTYLEDIKNAFNDLSVKQLKEFNDIYIKNRLVAKEVVKQVNEYDELFKKFRTQLLMVDTPTNKALQKKKRLNELTEEKQQLDKVKLNRTKYSEQLTRLKDAYQIIDKKIMDLNKYLSTIKQRIQGLRHQQFTRLTDDYEKELDNIKTKINLVEQEIDGLEVERTYQLFDPKKEIIDKIDNDLIIANEKLNEAIKEYNTLKDEYEDYMKQENNLELKKLLDEGKYFEENIPKLVDLHNKLHEKILAIEAKIEECDSNLQDYQTLIMEINKIENDD